jgi:hypothetical protein
MGRMVKVAQKWAVLGGSIDYGRSGGYTAEMCWRGLNKSALSGLGDRVNDVSQMPGPDVPMRANVP